MRCGEVMRWVTKKKILDDGDDDDGDPTDLANSKLRRANKQSSPQHRTVNCQLPIATARGAFVSVPSQLDGFPPDGQRQSQRQAGGLDRFKVTIFRNLIGDSKNQKAISRGQDSVFVTGQILYLLAPAGWRFDLKKPMEFLMAD